ncbi:MAG: T9SS type A sorting domain-containing protein [bacterium]|nr:T9SS type A sorting domain-containing protein [bacterium]
MVNYTHAIYPLRKWGRIAFLFLALCQIAHASVLGEGRWEWVYPWPSSYALMDMEFINEHEGWIVGHSGTILHTTDGGATWERQFSGSLAAFYTLEFIDNLHGWCAGGADNIWRTVDGGVNWIPVYTGYHVGNYYDIEFANENIGWAVGFSIRRTVDGGATWQELPQPEGLRIYDIEISPSGTLWAAAHVDTVYAPRFIMYSEDSGATWERVNVPQDAGPNALKVFSDSLIWMAGMQMHTIYGILYKSENRGITWQPTNLDTVPALWDMEFLSDSLGWASGPGGKLVRTTDGGQTWRVISVNDTQNVLSLSFPTSQLGFTSSAFGSLYKTTDGGETWTQLREYMDEGLGNIQHVGTDRIWAVGYPAGGSGHFLGGIFRSFDGGLTWNRWQHPEVRWPRDLSMANQSVGFFTGYYEGLWATYDGGENWNRIATVPDSFAYSVHASSANNVFVLGRDRLIVTYDGCQTWSDMGLPTDIPTREITEPLPGVMLAYGGEHVNENESRGVILIRNGETPWQMLCENDSLYFVDVQMTSVDDLWANAYSIFSLNHLLHSTDRGVTWEEIVIDNWGIRSFKMLSDEIGIALDQHYRVNVTDDGWRTWSIDSTYFQYGVSGFTLIGDQLFGETGGAIVKREVAPELFSRLIPTPDNFILSVYPNPFNASLSIALDLPLYSSIDVSLFDILGRRADAIFSGKLQSTTLIYSAPPSIATGSYFIKATTADNSVVKKVVLLK